MPALQSTTRLKGQQNQQRSTEFPSQTSLPRKACRELASKNHSFITFMIFQTYCFSPGQKKKMKSTCHWASNFQFSFAPPKRLPRLISLAHQTSILHLPRSKIYYPRALEPGIFLPCTRENSLFTLQVVVVGILSHSAVQISPC